MNDGDCHVSFLPTTETDKVQLARLGNTVYKFKIINNEFLKRLIKTTGINDLQKQVELIIEHILNHYKYDFPRESVIQASSFALCISTKPWALANIVVFFNGKGKFQPGQTQFLLTFQENADNPLPLLTSPHGDNKNMGDQDEKMKVRSKIPDSLDAKKQPFKRRKSPEESSQSHFVTLPVYVVKEGSGNFRLVEDSIHFPELSQNSMFKSKVASSSVAKKKSSSNLIMIWSSLTLFWISLNCYRI